MNITVLAGGISTERDISLLTGFNVTQALRQIGHNVVLVDSFLGYEGEGADDIFSYAEEASVTVDITPNAAPDLEKVKALRPGYEKSYFGPNVVNICRQSDLVFVALHGQDGENGKVQAFLELSGIPYTGSTYMACALAMDKGITKTLFMTAEIPTPRGITMKKGQVVQDFRYTGFDYPCVVKPCCGGSSIGVAIVHNDDEFKVALKEAFDLEDEVVVEEYIKGREFSVSVLDDVALPVIEIAPKEGFYDYKNKYMAGTTVETCPAQISDNIAKEMQKYAKEAAEVLGLRAYCRMDFIVSDEGDVYCLEANTLPGMTKTSLMPQEAAAAGISFNELCKKIIDASTRR